MNALISLSKSTCPNSFQSLQPQQRFRQCLPIASWHYLNINQLFQPYLDVHHLDKGIYQSLARIYLQTIPDTK